MCGIVGGITKEGNIVPFIVDGLAKLEYRGYDSVGVAVIDNSSELKRTRVSGRVSELRTKIAQIDFAGKIGIGHTRWATHGEVSEVNAHPHFSNNLIALVHNGIIENYASLRSDLIAAGYQFVTQTDTEVVAHLIHSIYQKNNDFLASIKLARAKLTGAYSICVINRLCPDQIVMIRDGAPLSIGLSDTGIYFASDISALLSVTNKVVYLEDGDIAELQINKYTIWNRQNILVERKVTISQLSAASSELGNFRHYMQKEMFEQPQAIADTIAHLGNDFDPQIFGNDARQIFQQISKIQIIACGTSYHAGLIARYWLMEYAKIDCVVDIASEYRYAQVPADPNTLIISLSQSGETADTLASIKYAIEMGMHNTLTICNVPESSLVRLSKLSVLTQAGQEIGVASTKSFTTQLVVLLYLTFTLAKLRGKVLTNDEAEVIKQIRRLPGLINECLLQTEPQVKKMAEELEEKSNALFIGRNTMMPIAMEGALKLKEISYIHAESYPAGELKHGTLALVDRQMPVVVLMPKEILEDKIISNVQEVLARKGIVYVFTNSHLNIGCHKVIHIPITDAPNYLLPIIYTIPMQLLSYHTAIIKGTDVDKPRNLAKSVTVE